MFLLSTYHVCSFFIFPVRWSEIKHAKVCESGTITLNCESGGKIYIYSAIYGQFGFGCGVTLSQNNRCAAILAHAIMDSRCNNRQNCSVPATNSVFGDPCPGTNKYLEVRYKCGF